MRSLRGVRGVKRCLSESEAFGLTIVAERPSQNPQLANVRWLGTFRTASPRDPVAIQLAVALDE